MHAWFGSGYEYISDSVQGGCFCTVWTWFYELLDVFRHSRPPYWRSSALAVFSDVLMSIVHLFPAVLWLAGSWEQRYACHKGEGCHGGWGLLSHANMTIDLPWAEVVRPSLLAEGDELATGAVLLLNSCLVLDFFWKSQVSLYCVIFHMSRVLSYGSYVPEMKINV